MRRSTISLTGVPGGDIRKDGKDVIFKEMKGENFSRIAERYPSSAPGIPTNTKQNKDREVYSSLRHSEAPEHQRKQQSLEHNRRETPGQVQRSSNQADSQFLSSSIQSQGRGLRASMT